MRTELVLTNWRCNQNCTYCNLRRAEDDLGFVQGGAVRARIDAAMARGISELVLTGGEPTLRNDLVELVRYARGKGKAAIVLETNATLIDAGLAGALAQAGLTRAAVNLSGVDEALDAVTRDDGGAARTLAGIRAFALAGITVELRANLVRSTAPLLPAIPARVASELKASGADLAKARSIVVTVPDEGPEPRELLPYDEAVRVILAMERQARQNDMLVRFGAHPAPPPCAFPEGERPAYLYALTRGGEPRKGFSKLPECGDCLASDACSGVRDAYLAHHGAPVMSPIRKDRQRRRLSMVGSVEEQMAREFITPNRHVDPVHGLLDEAIIRVNFHCNQACSFCFVSTHLPPMGDAAVRAAIVEAAGRGLKVTLSGGEPTLNPALVEYVALAKAHSPYPVQLQTNAVKLEDPSLVDRLAGAGLDQAFVSLHGSHAALSDAITEAPGTFVRTLRGLDNLAASPIDLVINFVICQENHRDVAAFVEMGAARWPRAYFNISFVAPSSDVVPRERHLIPRYADALPHLAEALSLAHARGLRIGGFESMCGIPLCLVPALPALDTLAEIPAGFDGGEFVKPAACQRCELSPRCYGLRTGYAALYGESELRPISSTGGADSWARTGENSSQP